MKTNTESTKLERLRVVAGVVLVVAGALTITVVGAIFTYSDTAVWVIGLGLIISGILVSKSHVVADIIQDLLPR